jgi:hypothetical protein
MTGIDVSPDGRSLAIAWGGDIAVEESALIIVDIATGESRERRVGSASNGPPSWLSNDVVALETLTLAAESGVASINVTAGNGPIPSRSRGFGLSATVDGTRIAVADDTTGSIVVTDPGAWWNGDPVSPGVRPPDGLGVVDLAIDADGTRLAAAFGSGDSPDYAIQIYHLDGGTWHLVRTLSLTSETPPTIDWLE